MKEVIHYIFHTAGATGSAYLFWLLKRHKINIPVMKTLTAKAFLHALVIAILTPVLSGVMLCLQQGTLPTVPQLQKLALIGLGAGISYILKNLFLGSGISTPTPPSNA